MNILLGVSGSISAYKTYDLLRLFVKEGHQVKIVLTKGANQFVSPNVFRYLGANEVYNYSDDFNQDKKMEGTVLHIDLVKWMDRLLIAPVSANTLAKFNAGIADDLLTTLFLANPQKPCFIYPAMNTNMLTNPITQRNMNSLSTLENIFIGDTESGELACKDVGAGKLLDIEKIKNQTLLSLTEKPKKKVLITTGATIAPLDPVRYLTNPASGTTGVELAKAFLGQSYEVILIAGHNMYEKLEKFEGLAGLSIYHVQTTEQMFSEVKKHFASCDLYISSAAISDIKPHFESEKMKKDSFTQSINYEQDIDIFSELSKSKEKQFMVAFAAETSYEDQAIIDKLKSKKADLIIANIVSNGVKQPTQGFAKTTNTYEVFNAKEKLHTAHLAKAELASIIIKEFEK